MRAWMVCSVQDFGVVEMKNEVIVAGLLRLQLGIEDVKRIEGKMGVELVWLIVERDYELFRGKNCSSL